ncbi:hypothetical protein [Rhodococcus sp. NPDC006774]|uniref:hypothetical protein n=1 Tax=Rhodococcus sp. NPDC006774 TaxID=3157186 RepID=UPI0033DC37CB
MLANVVGIGTLFFTAIATIAAVEKYSWQGIVRRRVAEYLERSRDLPCPRQREIYVKKVTREVWFAESLTRFKSRRSFGTAMAVMLVVSAVLLVATFPAMASSGNFAIIGPLVLAFSVAGVNYLHVLHCLSVASVNRHVYTALQGRGAVPVLVAPSFWTWVRSLRSLVATFSTVTGLEVLSVAAEIQQANGRRALPEFDDLDGAQQYAHLLDDASLAEAIAALHEARRLGGSAIVGPRPT